MRKRAQQALKISSNDEIHTAFCKGKPWLVLPVVGRRQPAEESVPVGLDCAAVRADRIPATAGRARAESRDGRPR